MPLAPVEIIAIEQLYAAYNFAADHGDGKGFADCFTPDGIFDTGGTRVEGSDALVEVGNGIPQLIPGGRHIASNLLIEGEGESVIGRAYLTLLATGTSPISILMTGQYEDRLVRSAGGWRFAERKFTPDSPIT
jgi:uncharacterized protein (TIGR02246 family)